ncbi:hypothetical protein Mpet_2317 [Methanolacinia petrolearia DSM 11571]|uniref:Uncharacterized protein n=1 Tax=Methanolacinia petrolearia (strain DSM 11571 / OCM 486 / SEBR 4847) TaxID=679926 RepID=E1RD81_METP4|nr:hypothetical protein [Methanolacinia petrolearia]ADN37064.1 hypothetical protein Mpet_2317 [Methanolacinia petrolearia DSM 11571]
MDEVTPIEETPTEETPTEECGGVCIVIEPIAIIAIFALIFSLIALRK